MRHRSTYAAFAFIAIFVIAVFAVERADAASGLLRLHP